MSSQHLVRFRRPSTSIVHMTSVFLKKLQRSAGNCATGKLHTQLPQKYKVQLDDDTTRVQAQEHLCRLHSLQEGVGTGWLEVRPIKDQWELNDATMNSALIFMLGLSPGPRQSSSFTCTCGHQGSDSHHAMSPATRPLDFAP